MTPAGTSSELDVQNEWEENTHTHTQGQLSWVSRKYFRVMVGECRNDNGQLSDCLCVFSSHSFWTSSSLDVPAGVTQEEGHTRFLIHLLSAVRALIFLARRIQPFLSLVDREVEFCVVVVVVSHIQRIGCQPEKTTLHGGQSRSWSAEQGKENKRKSLAAYPPPPTPTLLVRRK